MMLPALLKKYNLDVKQLQKRLEKAGVVVTSFKYIREVPEYWEEALKGNPISEFKKEQILSQVRKRKTKPTTSSLKGLKIMGDIDPEQFKRKRRRGKVVTAVGGVKKSEIIKNLKIPSKENPLLSRIGIIKNIFNEHGYIRLFNNINNQRFSIRGRDDELDSIFYFRELVIKESQILCIDFLDTRRGREAQILEQYFLGIIHPTLKNKLIVFHSLIGEKHINYESDEVIAYTEGIFKFQLHYEYQEGIIAKDLVRLINLSDLILGDLKQYLGYLPKTQVWEKEESCSKVTICKSLLGAGKYNDFLYNIQYKERQQITTDNAKDLLIPFIFEWSEIKNSPINIESFENRKLCSNETWIDLWMSGLLLLPEEDSERDEILISGLQFKDESSLDFAERMLGEVEETIPGVKVSLIDKLFDKIAENVGNEEFEYYSNALFIGENEKLKDILLAKVSDEMLVGFWLKGEINIPKVETISAVFTTLNEEAKLKIINQLKLEDSFHILKGLGSGFSDFLSLLFPKLIQQIKESIPFSVFDLEYRNDKLMEFGFISESKEHLYQFTSDEDQNKKELLGLILMLNKKELIIGHNILKFDLPKLKKKYGVSDEGKVWDTLQIEFLLNPKVSSAALKTEHTALADSHKSWNLFINQFMRISILPEYDLIELLDFLPKGIHNQIQIVSKLVKGIESQLLDFLEGQKELFFYDKKLNPFVGIIKERIEKLDVKKVIIKSPSFLHRNLSKLKNIFFLTEGKKNLNAILDEEKLDEIFTEKVFIKLCLKRFLSINKKNQTLPRLSDLSPYLLREISSKIELEEISSSPDFNFNNYQILCLDLENLIENRDELSTINNIGYVELGNDLSVLIEKKLIAEFDYETFNKLPETEEMWKHFSGGQSYTTISKQQLLEGNIEITDIDYDNFWVEKSYYDSYLIWGNVSNYDYSSLFTKEKKEIVPFQELNFSDRKNFKPIITYTQTWQLNALVITRLNPETRSRDMYWLMQSKLFEQVTSQNRNASILFIRELSELENLTDWFISKGYYIPSRKASLRRQIELLTSSDNALRMSVQPLDKMADVIAVNVDLPINFVIDSFDILDKWYALKNSNLFNRSSKEEGLEEGNEPSNENTEEEDLEESQMDGNAPNLPLRNDTGALLEILTPLIHYYRYIIEQNNSSNTLFFLDARLENRYEIRRSWNCDIMKASLWTNKDSYEIELNSINNFFPPKTFFEDFDLDIEESMEKIRKIFIGEHDYYDFQKPYMKAILAAKQDLLITLPTGGGKSVLFQGPSLYRSSFTRGLTLVISPLKALMEDQVQQLWKLGFWSSVDYLNQDKGIEVQNIYRKMAGGEINLLFITPERFRSRSFEIALRTRMKSDGGLDYCVFDEAHCISQWGNEFRPDYQRSARITWKMKRGAKRDFPILLFSATVSEQIYNDFNKIFK